MKTTSMEGVMLVIREDGEPVAFARKDPTTRRMRLYPVGEDMGIEDLAALFAANINAAV
jgi:hypothetical protein